MASLKLSQLNPQDVTAEKSDTLKLSELHPDEVTKVQSQEPSTLQALESGALSGSFLGKISAGLGAIPRAIVTGESPTQAYQALNQPLEQELAASQQAHPIATGIGQFAGAIPAIGATTALAGPIGGSALYGGLSGAAESGTPTGAATGAVIGGALGGIGEAVSPLISKGLEAAGEALGNTGFVKAFQLAKEGQPITGSVGKSAYAASEKSNIQDLITPFKDVMSHISGLKQQALQDATEQGAKIDVSNVLTGGLEDLTKLGEQGSLVVNKNDQKAFFNALSPFTESGQELTPLEADALNKNLRELKFKFGQEGSPLYQMVDSLQKTLRSEITDSVPGYSEANKIYSEFMNAGPDHIISNGMKDLNYKSYGHTNTPDQVLYNKLETLINKVPTSDLSATNVKDELIDKLQNFDQSHPGLLKESGFGSVEDYANKLNDTIKESKLYQDYTGQGLGNISLTKPLQTAKAIGATAIGPGTGSRLGTLLNKAGTMAKSSLQIGASPEQIAVGATADSGQKAMDSGFKTMYQAGTEELHNYASKLLNNSSTKYIGESLTKAIVSGDTLAKNAAVFAALQSPAARKIMNEKGSAQ